MRQLLNTLYVTSGDSYISRDGTNLVVSVNGSEVGRLPIHNIEQVVSFGHSGASPSAMSLCVENGVSVSFMSPNGRFLAGVYGETKGNVLLRRAQYRIADDSVASLCISKNMILGKVANSRHVLKKAKNNHGQSMNLVTIDASISKLDALIDSIGEIADIGSLRGLEGEAARAYYESFDTMILKNKEDFYFRCRNRRPPRDRINAMLSFVYSMLANDVRSALESVGLDPFVGFMHTDRPGRPSLALDIMEEMRPMADRVVLSIVNLRMVSSEGFVEIENGAVVMDDNTRKTIIDAWQTRKSDEITHPFIEEKIKIGLIPFVQSMLLAKHIRGEIDGYPPFIMTRMTS
jgi:CRISPR-associated protein Cas1